MTLRPLASNIRRLRERANLTLDELAAKASVDRGTINRLETGRQAVPRASTVRKLAEALGVSSETLSAGSDDEDAALPSFVRKTQMNVRIADDTRNALNLMAIRYGVKASHILHLAPLLFNWAAEASLKQRRRHLEEAHQRLAQLAALDGPKHLQHPADQNWRSEEALEEERRSIEKRDLFGLLLSDEALRDRYEESEHNPMAQFLSQLAKETGEGVEFEHWSPHWSHPGYTLGLDTATELAGGNEEAGWQIANGNAPLHDMPKSVRDGGGGAIAQWALECGQNSLNDLLDLAALDLGAGGEHD